MNEKLRPRIESLCRITGGKPEWYATRAKLTEGERIAGCEWNGSEHVKPKPGKLVKSSRGTWARESDGRAYALTAAECVEQGLTPGPGND